MPIQQTVTNGMHSAAQLGQGVYKKGTGFLQDFKDFINKGNAFDLAVAFVLSTAFSAVIRSLVEDIITPLFGLGNNRNLDEMFVVLRCGHTTCSYPTRAQAQADGAVTWNWGRFINTIIYLLLVGFFLFIIVKLYYVARRKDQVKDKACPYCCKDVDGTAARCPHCTSWLEPDIRRKVENEYNEKSNVGGTLDGERCLSTTTLGTSSGVLKEKMSMDAMNSNNNHHDHRSDTTRQMMTGAGVIAGATGSGGMVYNDDINNTNSGINMHSMNNGYMSNESNLYTNPLPGKVQVGYDGLGVAHQPVNAGYDGLGVDQTGHRGDGGQGGDRVEGDLEEGGQGIESSSSSKPTATF
ncbi:hypothetical protein BGZ97_011297 [Linnemannia gamsii]|uniref:Gated mechanosensitive channel n=1 Tax=Linnemannia gamsii TaxID=64522 RepID=A0A9P6UN77_9FUNG|nr:hypothetical protein BGZ97_011297 [Linnemannia gamsii]